MSVGLAIGPDRLSAALLRKVKSDSAVWARPLSNPQDTDLFWTELATAVLEMGHALELRPGRIAVVLLPPLVQIRRIELPRLHEEDLRRVLGRDAGKYFIAAGTRQVIGFQRLGNGRRSPEPVLVAAAPEWLVVGVAGVLEAQRWIIETVGPSHCAWAAGTDSTGNTRSGGCLAVSNPQAVEIVIREGNRLVDVRRIPVSTAPPCGAGELEQPEARAALHAAEAHVLDLVPEAIAAERLAWRKRVARRLWFATAALALVSLGILRLDLDRETERVDLARAQLRQAVAQAMSARTAIEDLRARLTTLRNAEATGPQWTAVLGTVASRLPRDAHLSAFRGELDSLVLEGVAAHAVGVFDGLKDAPGIAGVQARAPIRQETGDSQQTIERFSLAAWIGIPDSAQVAP
jgi:hypothetical protein